MTLRNLPFFFTLIFVLQQVTSTAQQPWKPVPGSLTTLWTDKVTTENPFPEYPRPTMTRLDWVNLNGLWDLSLQAQGTGRPYKQGKILVPYPVESALSGCGWRVEPEHELVYTKKVFMPSRWKGQRVLLHFGAVDWHTTAFVNGKKVGDGWNVFAHAFSAGTDGVIYAVNRDGSMMWGKHTGRANGDYAWAGNFKKVGSDWNKCSFVFGGGSEGYVYGVVR